MTHRVGDGFEVEEGDADGEADAEVEGEGEDRLALPEFEDGIADLQRGQRHVCGERDGDGNRVGDRPAASAAERMA